MNIEAVFKEKSLCPQQIQPIQEAVEYIKKHHIEELFNELLTQMVYHQPPNPKEFIADQLRKVKEENHRYVLFDDLITTENFEAIFDSYDVLNHKKLPYKYLEQGYFMQH